MQKKSRGILDGKFIDVFDSARRALSDSNLIWTNWKNPFVAKNLSLSYGDFQDYKQIFLSEVLTRVRQTGQRFEG